MPRTGLHSKRLSETQWAATDEEAMPQARDDVVVRR